MDIRRIKKIIFIFLLFIFTPSFFSVYGATLSKPANNLGLVGYWSFNDATSTQATDFSGRGNTGTLNTFSAPATASSGWGLGKFGSALVFDGSSDYVSINGVADEVTETSFAVSNWVKCSSAGDYTVWGTNNSTASQNKTGIFIDTSNNFYIWDGSNEAAEITSSGVTACNNVWHHVVYSRSGSTGTLYVDGVSQGTHTAGDAFASNDLWAIGVEWEPGLTLGFYLNGSTDEFRVYNRPLSQTDVTALYNTGGVKIGSSNSNLIRNGLVSHWTFDGKDTTDKIYDIVGSNHGYLPAGATTSAKTMGKLGQALSFNGTDREVDIADNASLNLSTSFTISAWIKRQGTSWSPIFDSSTSFGWVFQISDTNKITLTDTSVNDYMGTSNVQNGVWQHVVVVKNGNGASNTTFYLNGVADGTASSGTINTPTGLKRIGYDNSFFFNGSIDDVRVYNRALTTAEVKQIYDATSGIKINSPSSAFQGTTLNTGLVGYWPFNGLDITDRVYDRSGNSNDGYFVNMATSTAKVVGKVGQALRFDGTDDFINAGSGSSLDDLPAMTYVAWIKPSSAGNGRATIMAKSDPFSALGLTYIYFDNVTATNGISFLRDTVTTDIGYTTVNNVAPLNSWTHVVVSWDGTVGIAGNVKIYINGVESSYQITDTGIGSLESDSGNDFTIGARKIIGSERYFPGVIDEVRVYNRVLSPSEAKQLYLMGR